MDIELLVVPDCPNEKAARAVLREAANQAGIGEIALRVTVIDSGEEAARRAFTGSPTLLIDGVDPFAVPGAPTGVTCRVYQTDGGLSGVPPVAPLREALLRACTSRSGAEGGR